MERKLPPLHARFWLPPWRVCVDKAHLACCRCGGDLQEHAQDGASKDRGEG
jgi:hypothetical protein